MRVLIIYLSSFSLLMAQSTVPASGLGQTTDNFASQAEINASAAKTRTKITENFDVSSSGQYMTYILLLAVAAVAASILRKCIKLTSDIYAAGAGAFALIIAEFVGTIEYKNLAQSREIVRENGRVVNDFKQRQSLESLKSDYTDMLNAVEKKSMVQKIAALAFAGAAVLAATAKKKMEANAEQCKKSLEPLKPLKSVQSVKGKSPSPQPGSDSSSGVGGFFKAMFPVGTAVVEATIEGVNVVGTAIEKEMNPSSTDDLVESGDETSLKNDYINGSCTSLATDLNNKIEEVEKLAEQEKKSSDKTPEIQKKLKEVDLLRREVTECVKLHNSKPDVTIIMFDDSQCYKYVRDTVKELGLCEIEKLLQDIDNGKELEEAAGTPVSLLKQEFSCEKPDDFKYKNYYGFINKISAISPWHKLHAKDITALLGLGMVGTGAYLGSQGKSIPFIDKLIATPNKRVIVWGVFAALSYFISTLSDKTAEDLEANINKINELLKTFDNRANIDLTGDPRINTGETGLAASRINTPNGMAAQVPLYKKSEGATCMMGVYNENGECKSSADIFAEAEIKDSNFGLAGVGFTKNVTDTIDNLNTGNTEAGLAAAEAGGKMFAAMDAEKRKILSSTKGGANFVKDEQKLMDQFKAITAPYSKGKLADDMFRGAAAVSADGVSGSSLLKEEDVTEKKPEKKIEVGTRNNMILPVKKSSGTLGNDPYDWRDPANAENMEAAKDMEDAMGNVIDTNSGRSIFKTISNRYLEKTPFFLGVP